MTLGLTPIDFMKQTMGPISGHIDSSGGPHVLMGVVASAGQPHIYIIGNTKGQMKKELYEALAERLLQLSKETTTDNGLVIVPGGKLV